MLENKPKIEKITPEDNSSQDILSNLEQEISDGSIEVLAAKEQALQDMQEANLEYKQFVESEITDAEQQLIVIAESAENPVDKKEKVTNITGKLRNLTTGSAFRRVVSAAAAYAMYFGLGTTDAKSENPNDLNLSIANNIEASSETSLDDLSDAATPFDGPNEGENPLEGDKEDGETKIHKLESKASFELAKTDLNAADLEALDMEIEEFIEGFSDSDLEKIKSGKMILSFEAGSSPEPINVPIETSMGPINDNLDLSKTRAKTFEGAVVKKLAEKGIKNPISLIKIPTADGISENGERYASVTAFELTNENMLEYMSAIFVDGTGSMADDEKAVREMKEKKKSDTKIYEIETSKIRGKTTEHYFDTYRNVLSELPEGSAAISIKDEKDDFGTGDGRNFDSFEQKRAVFNKLFTEFDEMLTKKGVTLLEKMTNPNNPEEFIVYNYSEIGRMTIEGKTDINNYERIKQYLDWKMNQG